MTPDGFDDTGAQFAPELVDYAGDPCPAGVKRVRGNGLIDLAGGEHLPWPADQPALRVDLQRAKEQWCVCGGGHRGEVCDRSKSRYGVRKGGILAVAEG